MSVFSLFTFHVIERPVLSRNSELAASAHLSQLALESPGMTGASFPAFTCVLGTCAPVFLLAWQVLYHWLCFLDPQDTHPFGSIVLRADFPSQIQSTCIITFHLGAVSMPLMRNPCLGSHIMVLRF